ncbi:MAG: hypothetical protein SVR94_19620, partial [Pseudomonadota bacterium]|nr:hypothetical protein [Pseudomonadota bacterium]
MNSRRSVFIPLVERSFASEGHLLEVYTERATAEDNYNDSKALDKDWDPVAMYLRKVGLYRMGCIAASAVRKLGLKKNKTSIYQWFKPQAWLEQQRLHAAYPERIIEGHSCELGLALLLLMGATQTNTAQYVIATGALSSQAQREHDVQVLPVSNLTQKLQLVIR